MIATYTLRCPLSQLLLEPKIFTFSVKINSTRFNKFENSFDRPELLLLGYAANVNCQVTVLRLPCACSPTNKPSRILQHSSNNLFAFFGRYGDLMFGALASLRVELCGFEP